MHHRSGSRWHRCCWGLWVAVQQTFGCTCNAGRTEPHAAAPRTLSVPTLAPGGTPQPDIEDGFAAQPLLLRLHSHTLDTQTPDPPAPILQVGDAIAEGFAAQQLLLQLQAVLLQDGSISDLRKAGASEALALADKCLVDGADEMLQLLNVACQVGFGAGQGRVRTGGRGRQVAGGRRG